MRLCARTSTHLTIQLKESSLFPFDIFIVDLRSTLPQQRSYRRMLLVRQYLRFLENRPPTQSKKTRSIRQRCDMSVATATPPRVNSSDRSTNEEKSSH